MTMPTVDPAECWKPIPSYEGLYEFSNFLRVRSLDRVVFHPRSGKLARKGRLMLTYRTPTGSTCVHLSKNGKTRIIYVDRLVAENFNGFAISPPSEKGEDWKPIPSYESMYQASTLGRIWGMPRYINGPKGSQLRRPKLIVGAVNRTGYRQVCLCKDGTVRTFEVHRLVALTHVPNPKRFRCVNHIDGDKANNRAQNLEWCTQRHNVRSGKRVKSFDVSMVNEILQLFGQGIHSSAIARKLKISHKAVLSLTARWRDASDKH